jgi:hypothetical protein
MPDGLRAIFRITMFQEYGINLGMPLQDDGQLRAAISSEAHDSNRDSHD